MLKLLPYMSTYSGLLPLLAGVFFARRKPFVLFSIFIALGLCVDLFIAHSPSIKLGHASMFAYSFLDILFLLWFVLSVIRPNLKSSIKIFASIAIFIFWFWAYKLWQPNFDSFPEYSFVFDTTMEVIVALAAAYALIHITEGLDDSLTHDYLFFLTGIFFYSFCTFFIHSFIVDDFAEHIWFLGCIINIITMLIYTYAFYRQGVQNRHKISDDSRWTSDLLNVRLRD